MLQEAISRMDLEVSVFVTEPRPKIVTIIVLIVIVNKSNIKKARRHKYNCYFILFICFSLQEGKYHMRRCIDSGLWVPETGEGDDEEEEDEEEEDEDED